MIWQPKPGQRVEIRYRAELRRYVLYHGRRGTVEIVARSPGPINVSEVWTRSGQVLLDPPEDGERVVEPRGNLVAIKGSAERGVRSAE